jgi:hypothetical protein
MGSQTCVGEWRNVSQRLNLDEKIELWLHEKGVAGISSSQLQSLPKGVADRR